MACSFCRRRSGGPAPSSVDSESGHGRGRRAGFAPLGLCNAPQSVTSWEGRTRWGIWHTANGKVMSKERSQEACPELFGQFEFFA